MAIPLAGLIPILSLACAAAPPATRGDAHPLPPVAPSGEPRVTLTASAIPLYRLAANLTKQTGVVIRVGSGERDWPVRERRVHVSFRDLPLAVALAETARTLGYQLRRTSLEGRPIYRIWQTPAGRDYEAAMRTAEADEADRQVIARRRSVLSSAEAALRLTPEGAMKLKDTNPWLAFLGGTEGGRAYARVLTGLPAETRELMLRGRKVTLEAADLPADIRSDMAQIIPDSIRARIVASMGSEGAVFKQLTPARIVFQPLTEEMGAGPEAAMGATGMAVVLGEPGEPSPEADAAARKSPFRDLGPGIPMASLPLTGGDSPAGQSIGRFLLDLDVGGDFETARRDMDSRLQSAPPSEAEPATGIPPSSRPTDPRLLAEIDPLTVKPDPTTHDAGTGDLIRQLSQKTALSYVVEHYPRESAAPVVLPRGRAPLHQLLDSLHLSGFDWQFENGVVRIRPWNWAVERSYDVPDATLATYRAALDKRGYLDLDALAAIAGALTDEQIDHRLLLDPTLAAAREGLTSTGGGGRAVLRLYDRLRPDQRQRLMASQGLSFDLLDADQRQRVDAIVEEDSGQPEADHGSIWLNRDAADPRDPEAHPGEGSQTARFTLHWQDEASGGTHEIVRSILIPGKGRIARAQAPLRSEGSAPAPQQGTK